MDERIVVFKDTAKPFIDYVIDELCGIMNIRLGMARSRGLIELVSFLVNDTLALEAVFHYLYYTHDTTDDEIADKVVYEALERISHTIDNDYPSEYWQDGTYSALCDAISSVEATDILRRIIHQFAEYVGYIKSTGKIKGLEPTVSEVVGADSVAVVFDRC